MRLVVELLLNNGKIAKDKNRIVMYVVKLLMEKENKNIFKELYKENPDRPKDLNFSMYLGKNIKFLKDDIEIPDQKILVNFSTYDPVVGVALYNSFLKYKGLEIPIGGNIIFINAIKIKRTRPITSDKARYITKSPIIVRSHCGNNKLTHYHSLLDEKGKKVFIKNLKFQIKDKFPKISKHELNKIQTKIIWNKEVNVPHYGIVIPSNLCEIELLASPYILEYLYLAGLGGRKSQGFGYVDLVE